jgi:hypothetical protein
MRMKLSFVFILIAMNAIAISAQTSTFTYQGRLTDGPSPASGTYQMTFSLFDQLAPGGSTQIGSTITNTNVTVTNGTFTVQLDFSPITPFATGADRFLEISVKKHLHNRRRHCPHRTRI